MKRPDVMQVAATCGATVVPPTSCSHVVARSWAGSRFQSAGTTHGCRRAARKAPRSVSFLA
eukprot:5088182-Lingulodinium_polyedra.AAC.1